MTPVNGGFVPENGQLWQWAEALPDQKLLTLTLALDVGPSGLIGAARTFALVKIDDVGIAMARAALPVPPHPKARLVQRLLACGEKGCPLPRGHDGDHRPVLVALDG